MQFGDVFDHLKTETLAKISKGFKFRSFRMSIKSSRMAVENVNYLLVSGI